MSQLDRCIFLDNQNVKYISEDPGLLVLVLWWVLFHYKVKETKIIFINLFHSSASTCIILKVQRWYYYLQISFKTVGIRIYFFFMQLWHIFFFKIGNHREIIKIQTCCRHRTRTDSYRYLVLLNCLVYLSDLCDL